MTGPDGGPGVADTARKYNMYINLFMGRENNKTDTGGGGLWEL